MSVTLGSRTFIVDSVRRYLIIGGAFQYYRIDEELKISEVLTVC